MLAANVTAIPIPVTTKTCKSCNIEKPFSEFYLTLRGTFGLHCYCKRCGKMRQRKIASELSPEQKERERIRSVRKAMIRRCSTPTVWNYKNYGGRGITVCQRWRDSLDNFIADMGPRPEGYQLDRTNNDGNYEPSNCRWVTASQNAHNQRASSSSKTGVPGVFLGEYGYECVIVRDGITSRKYFKQRWDAICWRKSMENRYRETGAL